jgi:hypothetical protein
VAASQAAFRAVTADPEAAPAPGFLDLRNPGPRFFLGFCVVLAVTGGLWRSYRDAENAARVAELTQAQSAALKAHQDALARFAALGDRGKAESLESGPLPPLREALSKAESLEADGVPVAQTVAHLRLREESTRLLIEAFREPTKASFAAPRRRGQKPGRSRRK